jgi:hypothetical protein
MAPVLEGKSIGLDQKNGGPTTSGYHPGKDLALA